jgi:hypothetical protein
VFENTLGMTKIGSLARQQFTTQVKTLALQQASEQQDGWLRGVVESMQEDERFPGIVGGGEGENGEAT